MAVEWILGVGLATAKVVMRLYGKTDEADMLDDLTGAAAGPVSAIRRRLGQKDLGELLGDRIQKELPAPSQRRLDDPEIKAAVGIAADVVAGLAADQEALVTALAHPDQFPAWVRTHGGTKARQLVATRAETVYDLVLDTAAGQIAILAPTSDRATSAGMAQAIRDLEQIHLKLDELRSDMQIVATGVQALDEKFDRAAGQNQPSWPLTPRPAPAQAQAYQARDVTDHLPTTGTVVLTGPSGYGKTQIAAAVFARSIADLRLWIPGGGLDQILSSYADTAADVGIADRSDGIEDRATRFLGWLSSTDRTWLIVLDDLTDPAALQATDATPAWWPPIATTGRTLATTTVAGSSDLSNEGRISRRVDHYTETEAVTYLTNRLRADGLASSLPADVVDQAADLARDLGGHPLALAQAAAVIINDQTTTGTYRDRLREVTLDEAMPATARADGYTKPLHKAFQIARQRADARSVHAHDLLSFLAVLDPAGAPRALLDTTAVQQYLDATTTEIQTALTALRGYSLTDHTPQHGPLALRTHLLVGRLAREQDTTIVRTGQAAADALVEIWPAIETDRDTAAALRANAVQLEARDREERFLWGPTGGHAVLLRHSRSEMEDNLDQAAYHRAKLLLDSTLEVYGDDHHETVGARLHLLSARGVAHDPLGAAQEIEELLETRLQADDIDAIQRLGARHQIAYLYGMGGSAERAIPTAERVVEDATELFGATHHATLIARVNLAHLRYLADDHPGAKRAFQELHAIASDTLGDDHPDTIGVRRQLAHLAKEENSPAAVSLFYGVTVSYQRTLGRTHPLTLAARRGLADCLGEAGDPDHAVRILRAVSKAELEELGANNRTTLSTRSLFANWTGEAGDPRTAVELHEALVSDYERLFGIDHPRTEDSRSDLALWRHRLDLVRGKD